MWNSLRVLNIALALLAGSRGPRRRYNVQIQRLVAGDALGFGNGGAGLCVEKK